jgi:hypothetical protein
MTLADLILLGAIAFSFVAICLLVRWVSRKPTDEEVWRHRDDYER